MLTTLGASGQPIKAATYGKLTYDAGTDTYVDQVLKCAAYNDSGTLRYWARQVPAPGSAGIIISSYPTDADPYFRYTIAGKDGTGTYTQSISVTILRRATGTAATDTGITGGIYYWRSEDGPDSWYDVTVSIQNTKENSLPSVFDSVQQASDVVTSGSVGYHDPRSPI